MAASDDPKRRILVIEDDQELSEAIVDELERRGYDVSYAADAPLGLSKARGGDFHLLVVDRMLADIDGISIVESLRRDRIFVPALIISALGDVDERVRGLEAGADDYLTKPFSFAEMGARVEALLRRPSQAQPISLKAGCIALDLLKRSALLDGAKIDLTAREFELLEYFVRRPGQLITRDMLLEQVWRLRFSPQSNVVDVHISKLRRKIDLQRDKSCIRNVRGTGSSCSMQTVDIRTSIVFRRTLAIVVLFIASYLAIFGYIYLQMTELEVSRVKNLLEQQARAFLLAPTDQIQWSLDKHIFVGLRQVTFSALFDSELHYIEGNVRTFPNSLPIDGAAHLSSAGTSTDDSQAPEPTLFVALRLPDSRILLIGKSILYLGKLKETVIQALKIGVLPMAVIAIGVGALFSQRINYRLSRAQSTMSLYQQGQLDRRLPVTRNRDELDIFSEQVNSLLAELEHVVGELHQVGNNIAHDLRTPLARGRANLEKAQRSVTESDPSFVLIARAIQGLDQTFALTTALLRISQLELGKARASFCAIDLRDLIDEAADLYGPVAEAKDIDLTVEIHPVPPILGDRDLLLRPSPICWTTPSNFLPTMEMLKSLWKTCAPCLRFRSPTTALACRQKTRGKSSSDSIGAPKAPISPETEFGLTLVLAIVQLHNFTIDVEDGSPGSVFRLFCVPQTFPPNAQSSA